MKCLLLLLIGQSAVWAAVPIDGDWTPWTTDPTIDCCMYGGFAQYTRTCTNPSPENGGKSCFGLSSRWDHCDCDCKLECDGVTAFCANETGNPAFCMCVYGKVYPAGVDPDSITYCVDPDMPIQVTMNDTMDVALSNTQDVQPFTSSTKMIVNIVEFIFCGWVVAWCVATIIVCAVYGACGSQRVIHLMEEITLIVVFIFIGFFAMNVASTLGLCKLVSAILHYFFMCTMMFYVLEGMYAYSMISGISPRDGFIRPAALNIVLGFGVPLIPFAISFGTIYHYYGENGIHCWCELKTVQAWAVFMPVVILFFSAGILTEATGLGEHMKLPDGDQEQIQWSFNTKENLIGILLLTMFGYFIGIIAMDQQSVWVFALFSVFNVLLGPTIFVCHTKCHSKVSTKMNKLMPCLPFYKDAEPPPPPSQMWEEPAGGPMSNNDVPPPISFGPETPAPPTSAPHQEIEDKDADWRQLHAWVTDKNDRGDMQSQSENILFK